MGIVETVLSPFHRITVNEKSFIARQLAVMIEAGLPVPQAIQSLSDQVRNVDVAEILREILRDLENGYKLADALKKHPRVFNDVFVAVTAAGESTGKLSETMVMLADDLERDQSTRSRVMGAMLYPAFIVGAMIVVAIIMATKVVPALEQVFKESNLQLPWTTRTVVFITNSLIHFWYLYILGFAAVVYGLYAYLRTETGKRQRDIALIKLPGVGKVIRDLQMERFTRILGMMIASGVPIIQAIDTVSLVLDNVVYRDSLMALARNVERGATISQTLLKYKEFPPSVTEMIAVGEQTGRLDDVLNRLSVYFKQEVDQGVKNMAALLEPTVFVIVGLGVAFLVFSIIVPIYNLSSAIQ